MKLILLLLGTMLCLPLLMNGQEVELKGKDAFAARMKATCGTTEEGVTRYGMWEGRSYSRIPGEKDKHLFNVVGINVRQCRVDNDPVRGRGFKSVSREIMMYLDPKTSEIMDVWTNPWTGEKVDVLHVANDPVNMRGVRYEKNEDGTDPYPFKLREYGEISFTSDEIPLFYDNPLSGEYQVYVGGAYQAMEIFNTSYKTSEIKNANVRRLSQSNISWARTSQWLPWMEMGSKVGIMVFNATGFSTFDKSKIWPRLQKILDEKYPEYNIAPPLTDNRPNETSWTVFKKHMENKEKKTVRGKASNSH